MNLSKNIMFLSYLRNYPHRRTRPFIQAHSMCSNPEFGCIDKKLFHDTLPSVIDSVAANPKVAEIPHLDDWIRKLLTHNMTGGKGARGLTVVAAYETLEEPGKLTEESMRLARTLGWCYEMFQSFVCIVDDIMDGSATRRGKPCWYMVPEVGTSCAINDAVMLYSCMFYLLRKHFADRQHYTDMVDAINETMLYSTFGQFLDLKTSESKKDYNHFTTDRHNTIIKFKTAYYTYDLPTKLGLLLADYKVDKYTKKLMQEVSIEIGLLFQIQDDYIDCFGDESITGKIGTDIQEGKCSWLAVNALHRCTQPQRIVFNACYSSNEPAHVERIQQLYKDLKLPDLYRAIERKYYDSILEKIRGLPTEELKKLFYKLLGITYQRKK